MQSSLQNFIASPDASSPGAPHPSGGGVAPGNVAATQTVHPEPVPCFFWKTCRCTAALEKQGKSVCRECAEGLTGASYPLRAPTRAPLYENDAQLMRDLDMLGE